MDESLQLILCVRIIEHFERLLNLQAPCKILIETRLHDLLLLLEEERFHALYWKVVEKNVVRPRHPFVFIKISHTFLWLRLLIVSTLQKNMVIDRQIAHDLFNITKIQFRLQQSLLMTGKVRKVINLVVGVCFILIFLDFLLFFANLVAIKYESRFWNDVLRELFDLPHPDLLFKFEIHGVLLIIIEQLLRVEIIDVDVCDHFQNEFI